jgi:hypothetical protein
MGRWAGSLGARVRGDRLFGSGGDQLEDEIDCRKALSRAGKAWAGVVWVPYQRVVLPLVQGRNRKGVRVVTELAEVDISPL